MTGETKTLLFRARPPYTDIANTLERIQGWDIYGFHLRNIPDHLKSSCSNMLDLYSVIEGAKASPVPDDIIDKCKAIEKEYELNLSDVISADRHLGIGWLTAGLYHRGALSFLSYEKHLQCIHDVFSAFRQYFGEIKPSLVIDDQVGSFIGAILYAICAKDGIPIYALTALEYRKNYYWQRERSGAVPGLSETYEKQKLCFTDADGSYEFERGPIRAYGPANLERGNITSLIKRLAVSIRKHAIRRVVAIKNRRTQQGIAEVYILNIIRYIVQKFLNFRKELRRQYDPMDQIKDSEYVYFPLHFEPEASLMGLEPHFTNQMHAIELLSKSVPVGVDVRIKEHPAGVGNRPSNWIDTIAKFPRVKLVHPFENSIELIRGSLATATITGTSGLEAALLGKPVISFGPNYRFNFVDHVWHANDLLTLRSVLKEIESTKDFTDLQRNGKVLMKAIDMTCFKLDDYIIDENYPAQETVEVVANELLKHVDQGKELR